MSIFSSQPVVLIGPGSEWSWSAVSGLILAVTFIAIYRQLRLQGAANAVAQIEEWSKAGENAEFHAAALEILHALRDGRDPAYVPEGAARTIGELWDKFALMCRVGSRDPKLLWRLESDAAQGWWLMLEPRTRRRRAETGDPAVNESLEWLARLMAKMDKRAGRPTLGWNYVKANLEGWIEAHQDELEKAIARSGRSADRARRGSQSPSRPGTRRRVANAAPAHPRGGTAAMG